MLEFRNRSIPRRGSVVAPRLFNFFHVGFEDRVFFCFSRGRLRARLPSILSQLPSFFLFPARQGQPAIQTRELILFSSARASAGKALLFLTCG